MFEALGKLIVVIAGIGLLILYSAFSWGFVTFTLFHY